MAESRNTVLGAALISIVLVAASGAWAAPNDNAARRAQVVSHWTAERRAAAIPRDLVIDSRGLGYLRRANGSLIPHGHQISAIDAQPTPRARPGGGGPGGGGGGNNDSTPPQISPLDPLEGATIGASHTFSAQVSDSESGVKSVTFFVSDGLTDYSFAAANSGGDEWSVGLTGFTDGAWSWYVEAKDNAKKGGNTAVSVPPVNFTVSTGGGTGNGDTVTNSEWTDGGVVQLAAGRIFFEMPSNPRRKRWVGYVCSGTVVSDLMTGRSTILTAAHCVYDDANGAFARNVMFIPDQDGTTGSGTDRNCSNDPIGCWVTSFGVVDVNWTTSVFPANIPWDYAYYVVDDIGAHQEGRFPSSENLDGAVEPMTINFSAPEVDVSGAADFTHGMGYSYSDDPNFMYCAEDMTTEGSANWWLPSCELSGGSSGGPWVQPMNADNGNGPIISVNSWGYTDRPGMAGPKLSGPSSASCVFETARVVLFGDIPTSDGDAGRVVNAPNCQ